MLVESEKVTSSMSICSHVQTKSSAYPTLSMIDQGQSQGQGLISNRLEKQI